MREIENTQHFLAICPILSELRRKCFNKNQLSDKELLEYLNGKNWDYLIRFCKLAWAYRAELIREFNF